MNLLPQVSFSILLALSLKPRHGYEIITQVEEDSFGKIRLGAGSLYGSIKQLRAQKLIREVPNGKQGERRRYYELTQAGRLQLAGELEYFTQTVHLATDRLSTQTNPA